jgi:hypothetical protein
LLELASRARNAHCPTGKPRGCEGRSARQVQICPDHVGSTCRPMFSWLPTSRQWTGPRPINVNVIEHHDSVVLLRCRTGPNVSYRAGLVVLSDQHDVRPNKDLPP